jgi:hypothetical protein
MKLLITGIPGTGKTCIGNYLEDKKGYEHFDIEDTFKRYGGKRCMELLQDFVGKLGDKKVITWGFVPSDNDDIVIALQTLGYRMFWFDGNRDAARREFLKRNDIPEDLFNIQLGRIEQMDLNKFGPIRFNTFDDSGEFLDKEVIIEGILKERINY